METLNKGTIHIPRGMGGTAGGNARFDLAVQSNMQLL
jgi:hypothetical protein